MAYQRRKEQRMLKGKVRETGATCQFTYRNGIDWSMAIRLRQGS